MNYATEPLNKKRFLKDISFVLLRGENEQNYTFF